MATQLLSPTMVSRKLLALEFIKDYLARHPRGPSYGEIAAYLDTNRERVRGIVKQLAAERLIVKTPGHRGISLPGAHDEALRVLTAAGWKVNESGLGLFRPVTNPPLPLLDDLDDIPFV